MRARTRRRSRRSRAEESRGQAGAEEKAKSSSSRSAPSQPAGRDRQARSPRRCRTTPSRCRAISRACARGPFATREAADKALEQLKGLGFQPGAVTRRRMTWLDYGVIAVLCSRSPGARGAAWCTRCFRSPAGSWRSSPPTCWPRRCRSFPANMRPEFRVVGAFVRSSSARWCSPRCSPRWSPIVKGLGAAEPRPLARRAVRPAARPGDPRRLRAGRRPDLAAAPPDWTGLATGYSLAQTVIQLKPGCRRRSPIA